MPSSYHNRLHVTPQDVADIALIKLGSGSNLPGYYMYHGGVNPAGKLTTLNETRATGYPNDLPIENYDFEAPIGAAGQVREHWFFLRRQHLFLKNFGASLATMQTTFPEVMPQSFEDSQTVRWSVRSRKSSGFIFFSNHQRYEELPAHHQVQFAIRTSNGSVSVPAKPINIPSGSFGIFPFGLDISGVHLQYATVQPLTVIQASGETWAFFTALHGIAPEFEIGELNPKIFRPKVGLGVALRQQGKSGAWVNFVVLDENSSNQLSVIELTDGEHVFLSPNVVWNEDDGHIRLESTNGVPLGLAVFPPIHLDLKGSDLVPSGSEGIFLRFSTLGKPSKREGITFVSKGPDSGTPGDATDELSWHHATELVVDSIENHEKAILKVSYFGDAARVYANGKMIFDNFWNGKAFEIALWRLSPVERANLVIKILPWNEHGSLVMDEGVKKALAKNLTNPQTLSLEVVPVQACTLTVQK